MRKTGKKRPPEMKLVVKNFGEPIVDPATGQSVMHPGIKRLVQLLAQIVAKEYFEELQGKKSPP